MSDFRPVLVRVRNQLHPAPGAFGRVVKRRQRRRRNQRVAAALLSLSVAAASIGLVARAFLVGREPIRAGTSPAPGFPAILPELGATLPVGSEGGGSVIFAEGSVWVTASANDGSGSGYVVRVDPTTSEAVARIPVNAVPVWETGGAGIAAGAGSVWVTGYGELPSGESGAVLQRIEPETNQVVATVFLGNGQGQDVAVGDGAVWVVIGADNGQTSRDVVVRVDPTTNQVVATIPLEQQWAHWILATNQAVLVLEHRTFGDANRAGVFTVIDPATNEVVASAEPDLPGTAWGLAAWEGQVWTNAGGYGLVQIDPATGQAVGEPIRPVLAISGEGVAAGEGGIWFVGYNPNAPNERPVTVNRLTPATGEIDASAEVREARGVAIAVGAGAVWILDYEGNLLRVDLVPTTSASETKGLVAPFVADFLQARVEGSGAESFLTDEGLDDWNAAGSGLHPLYAPPDLRYESFAIVFVDDLGDGTFEVGVRMFGAHLNGEDEWFTEPLFEETLFLRPGEDVSGEPRLLVINGARPGLVGP